MNTIIAFLYLFNFASYCAFAEEEVVYHIGSQEVSGAYLGVLSDEIWTRIPRESAQKLLEIQFKEIENKILTEIQEESLRSKK